MKTFLTVHEFGEMIGVKDGRAYQLVHALGIAVRVSERRLLVPRAAVEALTLEAIERAERIARGEVGHGE